MEYIKSYSSDIERDLKTGHKEDVTLRHEIKISYFSRKDGGSITATTIFAYTVFYLLIISSLYSWWQSVSKQWRKTTLQHAIFRGKQIDTTG